MGFAIAFSGCCHQPTEANAPGIRLFAFSPYEGEANFLAVVFLVFLIHVVYEASQVTRKKLFAHCDSPPFYRQWEQSPVPQYSTTY